MGGFYRSGTTLLRRLLDSHPDIHCPPEIKFFKDFYGDYLNDPLAGFRFFSTVRSCGVSRREMLAIFGKAYISVREAASKRAGKRRWGDKNPENSRYIDSWDEVLRGELFYLHMLRNPCDVISSLRKAGFRLTVPQDLDGQLAMLNLYWSKALAYIKANSRKCLVIEYERLVHSPEQALSTVFPFIEEEFHPRLIGEINSAKRGRGIEDRSIDASRGIHTRSVNRFLRELSGSEIDHIRKKTARTYARLRDMALSAQ